MFLALLLSGFGAFNPVYFKVLNLFLALLLSSFGASNLSAADSGDDGTNKLTEAINRFI